MKILLRPFGVTIILMVVLGFWLVGRDLPAFLAGLGISFGICAIIVYWVMALITDDWMWWR